MTINHRLRAAGYTGKFDTDELLAALGHRFFALNRDSKTTWIARGLCGFEVADSPREALAELYCAIKEAE